MSSITFVEPPARRGGKGADTRWVAVLKELRANPDKWALVGDSTSNGLGYYIANKNADIERTVRVRPDGRWDIYMRAVSA
jgi:hypothetical protein